MKSNTVSIHRCLRDV